ncbi:MAG: type II toxin-antitoxin system RelE/ParE family toxin [Armatimonadota bacterium]|nr:type II toxin-antitoxin system RelE/ParE family toxin [Armatimonadota bacterium]
MYSISFTARARKQLLRLDANTRMRIEEAFERLQEWPAPELDIRPLRGRLRGSLRLRVGTYRVIFIVDHDEETISIAAIAPRGSAYRKGYRQETATLAWREKPARSPHVRLIGTAAVALAPLPAERRR